MVLVKRRAESQEETNMQQSEKTCTACNGDGWVEYAVSGGSWPWERDTCETCNGKGTIEKEEQQ